MLRNNKKLCFPGFLFPIAPVSGYILFMSEPKKSRKKKPVAKNVAETVAERYLDLWQDNIRFWATEPPAPPEDKG